MEWSSHAKDRVLEALIRTKPGYEHVELSKDVNYCMSGALQCCGPLEARTSPGGSKILPEENPSLTFCCLSLGSESDSISSDSSSNIPSTTATSASYHRDHANHHRYIDRVPLPLDDNEPSPSPIGKFQHPDLHYILSFERPVANYTPRIDDESPCSLDLPEIKKSMEQNGYCSYQINHLAETYDLHIIRRFARIDRRQTRDDDHGHCATSEKRRCIAYDSPQDRTYTVQHTADCSDDCYTVETPHDDLTRIVASGDVPLVSIQEENGRFSIHAHKRRFETEYATISHVWADGLGNPNTNALPACQIKRLMRMTEWLKTSDFEEPTDLPERRNYNPNDKSLLDWCHDVDASFRHRDPSNLIWMDTLCIPLHDQALRSKCIAQMASIYASSSCVFVLDKELMNTPLPKGPNNLMPGLYKIACSVWMCRSWTLQEAILPPERIFEFADGFFRPKQHRFSFRFASCDNVPDVKFALTLFDNVLDPPQRSARMYTTDHYRDDMRRSGRPEPYWDVMEYGWEELDPARMRNMERCGHFISVWNELAGRGTTLPAELYIVLATCLNFKLKQFIRLETSEEKMQHLIFSFETLPLSLFFNPCAKISNVETPYNRWIPARVNSYLAHGSTFDFPKRGISPHSDQGNQLTLHLGSDVSTLIVDRIALFHQDIEIAAENHQYRVQRILQADNEFDVSLVSACTSTCIIFENTVHYEKQTQQGACFFVAASKSPSQPGELEDGGASTFELIYFCPVTVKRSAQASVLPNTNARFPARLIPNHHIFQVRFHPIAGFKPLKQEHLRNPFKRLKRFERQQRPDAPSLHFLMLITIYMISFMCFIMYGLVNWRWFMIFPYDFPVDAWWSFPCGLAITMVASTFWLALAAGLSIFLAYVTLRGCDYVVEYGSFDDNTVLDRLAKSPGLIWKITVLRPCRSMYKSVATIFRRLRTRCQLR